MTDEKNECGIVALVIALLDGEATPAHAACGLPPAFLELFVLAEKFGELDRGEAIELSAGECQLLDHMLDAACELEMVGETPRQSSEMIAAMFKRVAFDNVPLEEWAWNLPLGIISRRGWSVQRHT